MEYLSFMLKYIFGLFQSLLVTQKALQKAIGKVHKYIFNN